MMNVSELIHRIDGLIDLAEEWSVDQENGLTPGEVCVSAMKDLRRVMNTARLDLLNWYAVEEFKTKYSEQVDGQPCWLQYKGALRKANYENDRFNFTTGDGCYMTECIALVTERGE